MKILNIDAYAPPKRALKVGDKEHEVRDMTLEAFMQNLQLAEELNAKGELTPIEQVQNSIRMISTAIPSLPTEVIRSWSIEQMTMVLQFIRGEMDTAVKQAAQEAGAVDAPAGSKS